MLFGQASPDARARLFAARIVVRMDMIFTLPDLLVQPLSGAQLTPEQRARLISG